MIKRNSFFFLVFLAAFTHPLWAEDDTSSPGPQKNKLQTIGTLFNADSSGRPTSVAGVRGLEEPGTPPDTKVRDFAAIDRLDLVKIKESDLKKFLAEGGLP
jgi:hypothetical protein